MARVSFGSGFRHPELPAPLGRLYRNSMTPKRLSAIAAVLGTVCAVFAAIVYRSALHVLP